MPIATLTSKGQITLPKEIRDKLHAHAGTRFDVRLDERGNVVLVPKKLIALDLLGMFPTPGVHATIEQIKDSIEAAVAEDYARICRQHHPRAIADRRRPRAGRGRC